MNRSIHQAAAEGELVRVRDLLDEDLGRVDAEDVYGWRPLFYAASRKHTAVVRLLIDRGADVSAREGDALHYAGQVPANQRIVSILIQYGALEAHTRPASDAARQFIHAIFMANAERAAAMLRMTPGLAGERYAHGDTALLHACRMGDRDMVRALVEHGADVNARNEMGHFPLYCAAAHGHARVSVYLLEQGADREMRLKDGRTVSAWLEENQAEARFRGVLEAISKRKRLTQGRKVTRTQGRKNG